MAKTSGNRPRAKFEPPAGQRLLIVGQELAAIGGFKRPCNDGYSDHFPQVPGGVTTYASLPWLLGLRHKIPLRAGPICAQCILNNPLYQHSALAIGMCMVGEESNVASGKLDRRLAKLADWMREAKRPVFLRIGYEFDGSWNHYEPETYQSAFRRVVSILRDRGAANAATVWQAATSPVNGNRDHDLGAWYPGDDFVDWVGYSWFLETPLQYELTERLLEFGLARGKPAMVCEAAPQGYDLTQLTRRNIGPGPDGAAGENCRVKEAAEIWAEWFEPFLTFHQNHQDTVRILAYINAHWDRQHMWGPPYRNGYWGDSRLQAHPYIRAQWTGHVSNDGWLHASPELFRKLGSTPV